MMTSNFSGAALKSMISDIISKNRIKKEKGLPPLDY